ncbi:hypothetical protein P3T43_007222 [Paraburkholderia sp. GAS41]
MPMIWLSVNLDVFMQNSLSILLLENSTLNTRLFSAGLPCLSLDSPSFPAHEWRLEGEK